MTKFLLSLKRSILISTLWTISVYAQSPMLILQQKLSAIHTMEAAFTQTIHAKHRVVSKSSGVMALARPDRFRWQTKHPMAQTVVADGKNLWIYDQELEQVSVSKQTRRLGAAGALFLSQDNEAVKRDFDLIAYHPGASEIFELRAKSHQSNFEQVRLVFKNERLSTIEMDDQLGQRT
ncbi:MAG TPA: outer membrane lipoprotein chaperone LolA, partial [Legionellaceae bacterium]|nr:outer membrane lipoprotein chaperone LolA [Legionellaceae bacterium]